MQGHTGAVKPRFEQFACQAAWFFAQVALFMTGPPQQPKAPSHCARLLGAEA
jgi:hypothetical protein